MKKQKTPEAKNKNSGKINISNKQHHHVPGDSEKDLDELSHEELNRTGKGDLAMEDLDDLAHRQLEDKNYEDIPEDFEPRKK